MHKEECICVKEIYGSSLGQDVPKNFGCITKAAGLLLTANASCDSLI